MMDHKYSTIALLGILGISVVVMVAGLDGGGTTNRIAKFISPERIIDSNLIDDGENLTYSGSPVCTVENGLCSGEASFTTSNATFIDASECLGSNCDTYLEVFLGS